MKLVRLTLAGMVIGLAAGASFTTGLFGFMLIVEAWREHQQARRDA